MKVVLIYLLQIVQTIPFEEGKPELIANGFKFIWTGRYWEPKDAVLQSLLSVDNRFADAF